jgi:putative copper export protein/methionine-rich copper-binding protein CopC
MPHRSRALRLRPGAPSVPRLPRGAALALLALVLAALALPRAAGAHTRLQSSAPAAGSTLAGPVAEVRLAFTTRVSAGLASVAVVSGGDTVAAGPLAAVEGTEGRELVFVLATPLAPGAYQVHWRAPGADGHVIRGDFSFTVTGAAPADTSAAAAGPAGAKGTVGPATVAGPVSPDDGAAEEPESEADGALPVLVRWGGFLALLGMIGAAAFSLGVLGPLRRDEAFVPVAERAADGTWYLAMAAAALGVLTLFARLWLQASALGGDAFGGERLRTLLMGTGWGLAWVLQAVATLAFGVGLMIARAPHGRGVGWIGAGVGALLLAAVPALSGHAAAVEGRTGVAILADSLHVLGAGVWMGTLAAVLAAGLPATLAAPEGEGPRAVAALVGRFSPLALAGAGTAAATGLVSTLFHVGSIADLMTGYGRVLGIKVLLLAVVAGLGWYNWRRVLPKLDEPATARTLRRSAGTELAVGILVVLVTAVLVALPTPAP